MGTRALALLSDPYTIPCKIFQRPQPGDSTQGGHACTNHLPRSQVVPCEVTLRGPNVLTAHTSSYVQRGTLVLDVEDPQAVPYKGPKLLLVHTGAAIFKVAH